VVRQATPQDAQAIADLLHRAFSEFEQLYTPAAFDATVLDVQRVLRRMDEGPIWIYETSVISGTVSAVCKPSGLNIRGIAVDPGARGQRIGEQLLNAAIEWGKKQGCTRAFLSTTPFLLSAIRLYERYGFARRSTGPQDLFGTPIFSMDIDISSS